MDEAMSPRLPGYGLGSLLPRSDEQLARRAASGDPAAFAAIFRRYQQDLYRYCHSILRDSDDAQDALQSTMASALRSLPGEQREIALRPWLFRVAHNHAISIVRARPPASDAIEAHELADHTTEARAEARTRLRALLDDLSSLSERQRAALTMRELSGLPFEEIGSALSISPQAARQTVYEARVALRDLEAGRAMECDQVSKLISAGDRRALRSRKVGAHLRACGSCRQFRQAIEGRGTDFAALSPPLPALAAAALLKGALDGAAGAATAGGAAGAATVAGKGLGALAIKSAASVVAATAIGVGAADYAGLVDTPLIGGGGESTGLRAAPAGSEAPAATGFEEAVPTDSRDATVDPSGSSGQARTGEHPGEHGRKGDNGNGNPPAHSNAGGNGPPAHSSAGGNPPAHSNAGGNGPPAHSSAGGNPPAHSSAGGNPPAHSNAGGGGSAAQSSTGGSPPAHSNAGGTDSRSTGAEHAGNGATKPPKPPK